MNAYQNFFDFFSMNNGERLDGLSEIYFSGMSRDERAMAFEYLLKMVLEGGSWESVNGLFIADAERAALVVRKLLDAHQLREDAEIAAAWNLYCLQPDSSLIPVFIRLMSSGDKYNRAHAAFYVPADDFTPELDSALKGMIRTETETLPLVNATNKYLECHGITRESVSKEEFSRLYRGLRSDEAGVKEAVFNELKNLLQ
ncbi:hypothetical protein HUX88_16815 [Duganella sp. BJB1802]|uniref:hypothetical protein n=1 Tax=Duganella sp. BJB1802 TaxID=2744575 RepID=UPI001592D318|nr:hypothetical protein [Duganella sp. BJB1802]NVD72201.1 hypothetical protein [Duganella sp. BJB1802]